MVNIIYSLGLGSTAGLNAYLPLLLLGVAARSTDLVELQPPFDLLTRGWVLAALAVLLVLEMALDKWPGVSTYNDVLQTLLRPLSGAVLFGATDTTLVTLHPVAPLVAGVFLAGLVHGAKITARVNFAESVRVLTWVSLAEDILVALGVVLALFTHVVGSVIVLLVLAAFLWVVNFGNFPTASSRRRAW